MMDQSRADEIQVKQVNMDEFNTSNLQAALAGGLQDFMPAKQEQEISREPVPAPWTDSEEEQAEETQKAEPELEELSLEEFFSDIDTLDEEEEET